MYGVVEISGHQYKVAPGRLLDVDKLDELAGGTIELDKVLFIGGEGPIVGSPVVKGALVKAKVIKHARDRKILMIKSQHFQLKNGSP
ncbi:MAG: 50S ribosomal protein L21 [Oligoflexia bacterium]|nr:50S ribosomal protein L21 [Oligoflexia bacterium]